MAIMQSRRRFVTNVALAGAAGFGALGAISRGGGGKSFAAEPPPEITTIRLERDPVTCIAPQVVEELLRAEGFTDIRYVDLTLEHLRRAEAANVGGTWDRLSAARDGKPSQVGVPCQHEPRTPNAVERDFRLCRADRGQYLRGKCRRRFGRCCSAFRATDATCSA